MKCEGVSARLRAQEMGGHSSSQPETPQECHSIMATAGPVPSPPRPGAREQGLHTFSGKMGLLRKAHSSRKGCGYRKAWGYSPGQLTESMGNCGHSSFFCCLTLVHTRDVKPSNSSDKANCANSWQANWGPLSVITVTQIPRQRAPVLQPSVMAAAVVPDASTESCEKESSSPHGGFLAALVKRPKSPQVSSRNPSLLCLQPSNSSFCSQDKLFSLACPRLFHLYLQLPSPLSTEAMLNYSLTMNHLTTDSITLPSTRVLCQVGFSPSAWNHLHH